MPRDDHYIYGPYLVFSDMSTYDSVLEDCVVAYITPAAQNELEMSNDFKAVEPSEMKMVKLGDMIDAYNQVHGTDIL